MAADARSHSHGYYRSRPDSSNVYIFTGPAINLVVDRFVRDPSVGPMSFSVHRDVLPAAFESLREAIVTSSVGHRLRRMNPHREGYILSPAEVGNHRTVRICGRNAVNFVIEEFIVRYRLGPVRFLVNYDVLEQDYQALQTAISIEMALHRQQRLFILQRVLREPREIF